MKPTLEIKIELTLPGALQLERALLEAIDAVAEFHGEGGRETMTTLAAAHVEAVIARQDFHADRERRENAARHKKAIEDAVREETLKWSPL